MKAPAFQFYPDDFMGGTADMTQSEVGAYILLLCRQWNSLSIPDDPDRLKLIAKGPVSDHVLAKFPEGRNPRLELVRTQREEWVQKCRNGGKQSAEVRQSKGSSTTLGTTLGTTLASKPQLRGQVNGNTPTPTPTPILYTHTSSDRDSNLPTWQDIQAEAGLRAIPEASAKSFWDHHEGNALWINQHGKAIHWRHKLTTWAANDRTHKPTRTYANNGKNHIDRNAGTYNAHTSVDGLKAKVR